MKRDPCAWSWSPTCPAELSVRRGLHGKRFVCLVLVTGIDRKCQGGRTPRIGRLARVQNSEKRSGTWWVGQSFSHRRMKRKGLGKGPRGRGQSDPSTSGEGQEVPGKKMLCVVKAQGAAEEEARGTPIAKRSQKQSGRDGNPVC